MLLSTSLFLIWIQRAYYFQMIVQDIQGVVQERPYHPLRDGLIEGRLRVERLGCATLAGHQRQGHEEDCG